MRNNLILILAGILIGAGIGLLAIFGFGLGAGLLSGFGTSSGGFAPALVPERDSAAADFQLNTLDGKTIHLADLKGKPLVINFWATWCGPCRLEMPLLQKYQDQHPNDMVVLAVNVDEPAATVQGFVDELGLKLQVLLDPGAKIVDLYRVRAFPTTFFVDANGTVRFEHLGQLNEDQLVGYLQKIGVNQ